MTVRFVSLRGMLMRILARLFRHRPHTLARMLDAGIFDSFTGKPSTASALFRRFGTIGPLDIVDWARRKGVQLPTSTELTGSGEAAPSADPFRRRIQVRQEAEGRIGERAWFLLSCYGRLMDGPHAGRYVGGVPYAVQLDLVRRLAHGETVAVHLMHRHRSGRYEASLLRWSQGVLLMVFQDREERA